MSSFLHYSILLSSIQTKTMNYNSILNIPSTQLPQLASVIQQMCSKLHLPVIVFAPLVCPLYIWLLVKSFQKLLVKVHPLTFALALAIPVWLGFTYCKDSILQHILIMVFVLFDQVAALAVLIHLQPLFLVLIVLVLARSNHNWKRLLKQISKLVGTWVALQLIGVFMGIEPLRVECGGYLVIHPQVYPPNSNLIWFLYTHMFEQYRYLFQTFLLLVPVFSIFPLYRIVSSVPKDTVSAQQSSLSVVLFVVYYFNLRTTVLDTVFYLMMKLRGYHFFRKHVAMLTPFEAASILFLFISILVSQEWATNFTVQNSFLFFMVMPLWALQAIVCVETVGAYAALAVNQGKQLSQNTKQQADKHQVIKTQKS